ncbi:hypothetical protein K2F43_06050 [Clostridium estertheticum]|uniref:hypothetical protein n=1 Tax=Clostridium estertheticum TaxID=238834 RepID=UPI001C6DF948|nr:hypothetical protein [Clostridium estertheticum]MBW9170768.1 hypothetical protein [Clostridium estertheticum]WLC74393.1 hypothetical protein KTC99_16705 [Clostridium estertheticum]
MPMKSCGTCGKIVPMNHVCSIKVREQSIRDSKREDKKIYWSSKWRKLRADILEDCECICLWSMYVEGVIRESTVCHHIVEVIVDDSKAYDKDNVIALNYDIHRYTIHDELYKIDKTETMRVLLECKRLWSEGVRTEGLGMLRDRVKNIK